MEADSLCENEYPPDIHDRNEGNEDEQTHNDTNLDLDIVR